jgi:ADP-ribose pyrophosphatase YjhB (NUDIX family)
VTDEGVERLLELLADHDPFDSREEVSLRRATALLKWLPHPFDRDADPMHVTASGIVVHRGQVLLHRHLLLGIWLQPGGHLEPDEAPADAVIRETEEETGIQVDHRGGGPRMVHVDVHEGPRGHLHIDLRYRLEPVGALDPSPGIGESAEVAWMPLETAHGLVDRGLAAALTRSV